MSRLVAALFVFACAPLTALAEGEPSIPAAPTPTANWNIGGGLSSRTYVLTGAASPDGSTIVTRYVPGAEASLERRLSARTWLAFGVSGSFSRQRNDVPPGSSGWTRADVQQLFVTAGVRHVITGSSAPVDVSLLVLAQGGASRTEDRGSLVQEYDTKQRSWIAGAELGISVDRELTAGLSLRVATPLVSATYSEGRVESLGQPARTSTALAANVVIAPRLELRLAF